MIAIGMKTGLILAAASTAVLASSVPSIAAAKTARSTMRVGMIIEPVCLTNSNRRSSRKGAPTTARARQIAEMVFAGEQGASASSQFEVEIRHHLPDTGKWEAQIVLADGEDSASQILLIDKCSGEVSWL